MSADGHGDPAQTAGVFDPIVWVNGERLSDHRRSVSARDRGFTLGDGVFETMRLCRGHVFRHAQHRHRLRHGLSILSIQEPAQLDAWIACAVHDSRPLQSQTRPDQGRAGDEGTAAALRVTVTRGVGPAGLAPPPQAHPTVVVSVAPLPLVAPTVYARGLTAQVARGRRNERSMTAGIKTTAYADAVIALLEAERDGADEAIFLDTQDRVSEATASNLFVVSGRRLLTPPRSCGALPGITREVVMELAGRAGLSAVEEAFDLRTLLSGEEAFLTSSLRGLVPLVRVNGQALGAGTPGACTRALSDAYWHVVEGEVEGDLLPGDAPARLGE